MEPLSKRPERPKASLLLGTALVLVLAFIVIVILFFGLSSMSPVIMGKCVAVMNIDQELAVEGSPATLFSPGSPGSEEIASTVESLDKRDDVGAVVFVINSPGGSVVATREIYNSVKGLKKPKVSYFREVAASGAYYVASGTDYIVSEPDAITGSIGVKATFTEMSGLLDKVGVNVTEIKSGQYKDMGSSYRNMTPEEQAIVQGLVDEIYEEFKGVVIENRKDHNLSMPRLDEITDGRIMSGRQAQKVGLVDQLGTKKDAIMKAAELANISANSPDDVRICDVSTDVESGGLFSLDTLFRQFQAKSGFHLTFGQ